MSHQFLLVGGASPTRCTAGWRIIHHGEFVERQGAIHLVQDSVQFVIIAFEEAIQEFLLETALVLPDIMAHEYLVFVDQGR